jgi:NAD(P)H-dependent FMN reductase
MSAPRILGLAGSLRADSYNRRLVHVVCEAARRAGGNVTEVDLREYPIPVFDEDLEAREGPDENVRALKAQFAAAGGIIIGSPEYNSTITAALKNVIDWVSRRAEGDRGMVAFNGKSVVVVSASPGALGGVRSLNATRGILSTLGTVLLPQNMALPRAGEAFAEDGTLRDAATQKRAEAVGAGLVGYLRRVS